MRRRDLLAGLGALATFGAAGWYALEGDVGGRTKAGSAGAAAGPTSGGEPAPGAGSEAGSGSEAAPGSGTPGETAAGIRPVTVETVKTGHSTTGEMTVPDPDSVTVIDVFATWCTGCDEQLRRLAAASERVPAETTFVSVTNQAIGGGLTRDDIRSFWREHAGRWPVALDDDGALTTRLGVRGLPHTAVTDPAGRIVFQEQGVTTTDAVVDAVERTAGQ
jgi:thiol-disulfide isomerase/thioredoxin